MEHTGRDKRVLVWDMSNGSLLVDYRGHTSSVKSLSFSRDNNILASGECTPFLRELIFDYIMNLGFYLKKTVMFKKFSIVLFTMMSLHSKCRDEVMESCMHYKAGWKVWSDCGMPS